MKRLAALLFVVLVTPVIASAQGLRMSADFLPLAVGNRWIYKITNEDGKDLGEMQFDIADHKIVAGKSYYIISGFPFVENGNQIHLLRYDKQQHQFERQLDGDDGPLFLGDGAAPEVTEQDSSGLPMKFVLRSPTIALTFQRGVGIIEARTQTPNGVQIAKISAARVGEGVGAGGSGVPASSSVAANGSSSAGQPASDRSQVPGMPPPIAAPKTPEQRAKELTDSVGKITADNPQLLIEVEAAGAGHKFILTVTNNSDKLLPFTFNSSEKFDFAVIDPSNNHEVWRMSRQTFPSAVKMAEAILPHQAWQFDFIWNHRDNDGKPVAAGSYQIVGYVTTQPGLESEPVTFTISPK